MNVYDAASELYNQLLKTYFDECNDLSDAKRKNIERKHDPRAYFRKRKCPGIEHFVNSTLFEKIFFLNIN